VGTWIDDVEVARVSAVLLRDHGWFEITKGTFVADDGTFHCEVHQVPGTRLAPEIVVGPLETLLAVRQGEEG
jgi:hypothetical protein